MLGWKQGSAVLGLMVVVGLGLVSAGCGDSGGGGASGGGGGGGQSGTDPRVVGGTPEQVGRYLVLTGGCNECHTPGYRQSGRKVPEGEWLTGVAVGWRGPWGTTYAANLRTMIQLDTEDDWVRKMRLRSDRPPMPWESLHTMSDADLRAVYAYIKGLGPKGQVTPMFVPPGTEPTTPYIDMTPKGMTDPAVAK
jgi:hypothetical protein